MPHYASIVSDMHAILLKWDEAFVAAVDADRGDVPRTVWIRRACERALAPEPRVRAGATPPKVTVRTTINPPAETLGFSTTLGPQKPKPGTRLKK